jgi:hypothetical protein
MTNLCTLTFSWTPPPPSPLPHEYRGTIIDVRESGRWLYVPLYFVLNIVHFQFFESFYFAAACAMVDPARSRSERQRLMRYKVLRCISNYISGALLVPMHPPTLPRPQARQATFQSFPQVVLQTFIILYLFCTKYLDASNTRQSASTSQVPPPQTPPLSTSLSSPKCARSALVTDRSAVHRSIFDGIFAVCFAVGPGALRATRPRRRPR